MGSDVDNHTAAPGGTLDTTTPAEDREMSLIQMPNGTTNLDHNIDGGWVMAPDGKTLGLDGETTPLGLNYAEAEWVVSGVVNATG